MSSIHGSQRQEKAKKVRNVVGLGNEIRSSSIGVCPERENSL